MVMSDSPQTSIEYCSTPVKTLTLRSRSQSASTTFGPSLLPADQLHRFDEDKDVQNANSDFPQDNELEMTRSETTNPFTGT